MKTLVRAVAILISFALPPVFGAAAEEEASFLIAVKQAFAKHDTNALFTLTCWDRVPDRFIESAKNASMKQITREVSDITLVNPDSTEHRVALKGADGFAYLPNLPVTKKLKIVFILDGHLQSQFRPVGEKNGKLYLLQNAPVEPDKMESTSPVGSAGS